MREIKVGFWDFENSNYWIAHNFNIAEDHWHYLIYVYQNYSEPFLIKVKFTLNDQSLLTWLSQAVFNAMINSTCFFKVLRAKVGQGCDSGHFGEHIYTIENNFTFLEWGRKVVLKIVWKLIAFTTSLKWSWPRPYLTHFRYTWDVVLFTSISRKSLLNIIVKDKKLSQKYSAFTPKLIHNRYDYYTYNL